MIENQVCLNKIILWVLSGNVWELPHNQTLDNITFRQVNRFSSCLLGLFGTLFLPKEMGQTIKIYLSQTEAFKIANVSTVSRVRGVLLDIAPKCMIILL